MLQNSELTSSPRDHPQSRAVCALDAAFALLHKNDQGC